MGIEPGALSPLAYCILNGTELALCHFWRSPTLEE